MMEKNESIFSDFYIQCGEYFFDWLFKDDYLILFVYNRYL